MAWGAMPDLSSLATVLEGRAKMTVQDVMDRRVVWVNAEDSLEQALQVMRRDGVDAVLVQVGQGRRTFGIMTMRDIIEKSVASAVDPATTQVGNLMSSPVVTVTPEMSIRSASALMARSRIRRLPVFDGHEIVGLLTDSAIFQLVEEGGWDRLD